MPVVRQLHHGKKLIMAVSIESVSKRFGRLQALSDVNLNIAEGEFFGLLGPNGAGKTTLISCLAGLVRPDSGRVRVLGKDVVADYRQARLSLGVVPQELVFDPFFTVRETLRLQSGYFGIKGNDDWIDEILSNLDLLPKADTNMRRLSGGMKRRVLVAQALVHRPPVIVLDEPTAGVDVELRLGLWQFIRRLNREGHTVILTTHYLEEAEALCGRIAMMRQGRVVALDSTANLLQQFSSHTLRLRLAAGERLPTGLQYLLMSEERSDFGVEYRLKLPSFADLESVLAALRLAGVAVDDLRLSPPDLEEAFVAVMRRESRESRESQNSQESQG